MGSREERGGAGIGTRAGGGSTVWLRRAESELSEYEIQSTAQFMAEGLIAQIIECHTEREGGGNLRGCFQPHSATHLISRESGAFHGKLAATSPCVNVKELRNSVIYHTKNW